MKFVSLVVETLVEHRRDGRVQGWCSGEARRDLGETKGCSFEFPSCPQHPIPTPNESFFNHLCIHFFREIGKLRV